MFVYVLMLFLFFSVEKLVVFYLISVRFLNHARITDSTPQKNPLLRKIPPG